MPVLDHKSRAANCVHPYVVGYNHNNVPSNNFSWNNVKEIEMGTSLEFCLSFSCLRQAQSFLSHLDFFSHLITFQFDQNKQQNYSILWTNNKMFCILVFLHSCFCFDCSLMRILHLTKLLNSFVQQLGILKRTLRCQTPNQ